LGGSVCNAQKFYLILLKCKLHFKKFNPGLTPYKFIKPKFCLTHKEQTRVEKSARLKHNTPKELWNIGHRPDMGGLNNKPMAKEQ